MAKLKVGLIGCGAIGMELAKACQDRLRNKANLYAVCDVDEKKADVLAKSLKGKVLVLKLDEIVRRTDLIVEAASASVSADVLSRCIKSKKDCMIMSVGGLVGKEELLEVARKGGINVYIPSGAICGIDALKAACMGRVDSVRLTTRKPPKGLQGAPYLKEKNINIFDIKKETVIFEGSAEDAVKGFPQNVNVSATLSLAGIGAKKTIVRIVTSPAYTTNTHEVEISGNFGKITTRTDNVPSKTNPKTSELAILSAIATLKGITRSVRVGT
jgi:aspartate dehydrogenase